MSAPVRQLTATLSPAWRQAAPGNARYRLRRKGPIARHLPPAPGSDEWLMWSPQSGANLAPGLVQIRSLDPAVKRLSKSACSKGKQTCCGDGEQNPSIGLPLQGLERAAKAPDLG